MRQNRRVVVTGLGAVTPIGIGAHEFWQGLLAGRSGVVNVTHFDCSAIATRIAAQVEGFRPEDYLERKDAKRMDRFCQFAIASAQMAVSDANLTIDDANRARVGVFIGSGIGGIATLEDQHTKLMEGGLGRVSPFFIPMMIANIAAGQVALRFGAQGPSECAVTACATSSNSIGDAFDTIRRGAADAALAGGSEAAITPLAMAGFSNMRAMTKRNDDPAHASRPFDKNRDGFILGEGSGIVVLEALDTALARGAHIHAEIIGYGTSNDAYDLVHGAPEGRGVGQAIVAALQDADITPELVGYVNAHATSTPSGDPLEMQGTRTAFGDHARRLAISSTKSMTGHLLGAAGAVEAIATVLALKNGILPPTINLEDPDPECGDLDFVPNKARKQQVEIALSNSFGFGGHNATLVFKRWAGN